VRGRLRPPSSKSLTHRALALALLSRQPTVVRRPLAAEDTDLFLAALATLGFRCERISGEAGAGAAGPHASDATDASDNQAVAIFPPDRQPGAATLVCGNAGTMFRFLVAIAATLPGSFRIDGVARLRERPVRPLTGALQSLGVAIDFPGEEGHAPLVVHGGRLPGGRVRLDASASSQYLSALLLAGQCAASPLEIEVAELASAPYVGLTLDMIERFGGRVETVSDRRWVAHPGALSGGEVEIEADFSAAAYPAAAAAVSGGTVRIDGVARSSRQGDRRLFDLLAEMGVKVSWSAGGATVEGGSALSAIDADLGDIPDQVPTLAALAPFARGTTRIRNVAHLRIKESDRLAAMTSELRRAGAEVEELDDGLIIPGRWAEREPPDFPVVVDPHGDHRIAMAMALVGLRRPNLEIADPACVGKSYPGFWRDLARLLEGGA
jgi:3-phosphoshikimate 1-carboxyvinyltransferase